MLFKKNKVDSPSAMIEKAVGVVDNAVTAFKVAVAEIDKANELLKQSKEHSQTQIESLESQLAQAKRTKDDAEAKINSHLELRDKLSQFIQ
jgi:chromosome segregation ATPase